MANAHHTRSGRQGDDRHAKRARPRREHMAPAELQRHQARLEQIRSERAERGGAMYAINNAFRRLATAISHAMGSPWAFVVAAASVVVWAALGKTFDFSETWQLVINTGTTIVTFLMIFLVQNTQNRDSRALHLKLDELLRGVKGARTGMVDLEDATDEELDQLQKQFEHLRRQRNGERQQKPAEKDQESDERSHHEPRTQ